MKKHLKKAGSVLENKNGEGYVDTAVIMIISVVIGALLLGGLYSLFNSIILPGLAERIHPEASAMAAETTPPSGSYRLSITTIQNQIRKRHHS